MSKKTIAVLGATGAQGGGLVRAILEDKNSPYRVRAISRNPDSDKAKALAELGAEVVKADVDDEKSLTRAFKGAYGVFCVTFFWEHFSPEKEVAEATAMARAAKQAGVEHVIWSTLEDTRRWVPIDDDRMPTLQGKYKVPHFDGKGEANQEFTKAGVPTTFLLTSFYWENLIHFGMGPKRNEEGQLAFVLPMADKRLPGIAAEDIGMCAYGIFKAGTKYIGKTVGIAGEKLTGEAMAKELGGVLGTPVSYSYVPPEVYRTFGFDGADDLANMFQFKRDFENDYCDARDLDLSRQLNPKLHTFHEWLEEHKGQIPVS